MERTHSPTPPRTRRPNFACQVRASIFLHLTLLALLVCGGCASAPPHSAVIPRQLQQLGVVTDVQPLVVQPDPAKWRQLKLGMTEGEVTALMGAPFRKDPRPTAPPAPNFIQLYSWTYGELTFQSFTTKGTYDYAVVFHEGQVREIRDPWNGRLSPDGRPTVPELVQPVAGQTLDHYPRFLDFRWHPASGVYPVQYDIEVEVLGIDQHDAEHFEDYIRRTVDYNRAAWKAEGLTPKAMDDMAASFARELRAQQGVEETFQFLTHDLYVPLTWVGANTGRWRVRALNEKGSSAWTTWRYFRFSR